MRWGKLKIREKGRIRIVFMFLWFPVKLQGQTRWLEMAKVKQWCDMSDPYMIKWENIEWADNAELVDKQGKRHDAKYEGQFSRNINTEI